MATMFYIKTAGGLCMGYRNHLGDDESNLKRFAALLLSEKATYMVMREGSTSLNDGTVNKAQLLTTLQSGIPVNWEETYDFVNPFGDYRGILYQSSWTFDLLEDVLILAKDNRLCSTPLALARERQLTMADFQPLSPPRPFSLEEQTFSAPYWDLEIHLTPQIKPFLGKILGDFAHVWRHILRSPMNRSTFMRLAYATIWIATMQFSIRDRTEAETVLEMTYVMLEDLPSWLSPDASLLKTGHAFFALSHDTRRGLEKVRRHIQREKVLFGPTAAEANVYAVLSLRRIILCRVEGDVLHWTKPEPLFDGQHPASDRAIEMLLWAANGDSKPSSLNNLPTEIQNRILFQSAVSAVSAAKLGCEIGLGSPFVWVDSQHKVNLQLVRRNRPASHPVESQIMFNGIMSGVAYKPEPPTPSRSNTDIR